MKFIGLDLAWSSRNNTGGAVIEWLAGDSGRLIEEREKLGDNDELLDFVRTASPNGPALLAIDAPLAVPNVSGARPCDRLLTQVFAKYQAGTHPANRTNLGRYGQPPGDIRGETLAARLVAELGFQHEPQVVARQPTRQLFECYPHPAMIVLFRLARTLKYKRKLRSLDNDRHTAYAQLQLLLAALADPDVTPRLEIAPDLLERDTRQLMGAALKHYEDLLDAIMCAYVAFYYWWWGAERVFVFGDIATGHIVTPITPELRSLAQSLTLND